MAAATPHPRRWRLLRMVVGVEHALCVSTEGRRSTFTEGLDLFRNAGPGAVRIDGVAWAGGEGLELLEVRIVTVDDRTRFGAFGVQNSHPPTDRPYFRNEYRAWSAAVPVPGAVLEESGPGEDDYHNAVLGFRGEVGRAGPLRISYTDAQGRTGVLQTLVTVRVARAC